MFALSTTENSTNNIAFAVSTALAEQVSDEKMDSTSNAGQMMEGRGAYDPSLPDHTTKTVSISGSITGVDFTDGLYKELSLAAGYVTTDNAVTQLQYFTSFAPIPMNMFLGLRSITDIANDGGSSSSTNNFDFVFGDQTMAYVPWNRFKGATIKLRNFAVTIERDASGGVQMKDEPVFEIMNYVFTPFGLTAHTAIPTGIDSAVLAKFTGHRYTTNLKGGLTFGLNAETGWGFSTDTFHGNRGATATGTKYVYYSMEEWQYREGGNFVNPFVSTVPTTIDNNNRIVSYPRMFNLHSPYTVPVIRWRNPINATNVACTLSYTWELISNWDCQLESIYKDVVFLTLPGGTIPASKPQAKKIKLMESY